MKTILFSNAPHWELERDGENKYLRGGIRAGSRWPFTRRSPYEPDAFRFGSYMPYPFFLGSAAAYVKRALPDAKVLLIDSIARGDSYSKFFRQMEYIKPTHYIIETGAASWAHDRALLTELKVRYPSMRIAVAGPTAKSAYQEFIGTDSLVSAFLQGEYEKNSLEFVNGRDGLLDFAMLTTEEMNALPFPMFDEQCALNYWDGCPKGQRAPHLQLFTSRGCVYKCSFCAWPAVMTGNDPDGTKARMVRFHSPEWVEAFILDFLKKHPEVESIYIDDDTFNLRDSHVLKICEVMKRIGLPWSAMCRADTSKRETWLAMKDSGCFGVKLGFESGSQRVVDEIVNKKLNLKEAAETAVWLRTIGMTVHGTFTVGLPGETHAERDDTVALIDHLYETGALDTHQLSGTATIEGTPLDAIAKGASLKVYPGAVADGDFIVSHDGQRKVEHIVR